MEFTKLKDLNISKIILGTWAIGGNHWGEYDEHQAIEAIETAIEHGVTTIDTAPAYGNGHAERLIGGIIKKKDRSKIIIATKCGLRLDKGFAVDLSPEFIQEEIDNSLKRLQTDYIDLYQCHWPDPQTPIQATMECLLELQQKGKIKQIGISNFRDNEIRESLKYADIATLQPQYSLIERSIETKIQKTCVEKKIAIIPYGGLSGGLLTGKYTELPKFSEQDARSFFYRGFQAKNWEMVQPLIKQLRKLAQQYNVLPGNIALAWLLAQPAVAGVIVGARNKQQVLENNQTLSVKLTVEEIKNLGALCNIH